MNEGCRYNTKYYNVFFAVLCILELVLIFGIIYLFNHSQTVQALLCSAGAVVVLLELLFRERILEIDNQGLVVIKRLLTSLAFHKSDILKIEIMEKQGIRKPIPVIVIRLQNQTILLKTFGLSAFEIVKKLGRVA